MIRWHRLVLFWRRWTPRKIQSPISGETRVSPLRTDQSSKREQIKMHAIRVLWLHLFLLYMGKSNARHLGEKHLLVLESESWTSAGSIWLCILPWVWGDCKDFTQKDGFWMNPAHHDVGHSLSEKIGVSWWKAKSAVKPSLASSTRTESGSNEQWMDRAIYHIFSLSSVILIALLRLRVTPK